jgi:hypothetical protein
MILNAILYTFVLSHGPGDHGHDHDHSPPSLPSPVQPLPVITSTSNVVVQPTLLPVVTSTTNAVVQPTILPVVTSSRIPVAQLPPTPPHDHDHNHDHSPNVPSPIAQLPGVSTGVPVVQQTPAPPANQNRCPSVLNPAPPLPNVITTPNPLAQHTVVAPHDHDHNHDHSPNGATNIPSVPQPTEASQPSSPGGLLPDSARVAQGPSVLSSAERMAATFMFFWVLL